MEQTGNGTTDIHLPPDFPEGWPPKSIFSYSSYASVVTKCYSNNNQITYATTPKYTRKIPGTQKLKKNPPKMQDVKKPNHKKQGVEQCANSITFINISCVCLPGFGKKYLPFLFQDYDLSTEE